MGKKVSQSSLKITKNHDKKQLHSLIKVLRPRVYITDSSSFKRLVQELTGNGSPISISISSPPPIIPQPLDQVPVIEIEDLGRYQENSSTVELSIDSSESVPTPFSTAPESSPELSMPGAPFAAYERSSIPTHQMDFSQYMDIESWLLETETFPYYDSYALPLIQQEVCVYDYDLSGLI